MSMETKERASKSKSSSEQPRKPWKKIFCRGPLLEGISKNPDMKGDSASESQSPRMQEQSPQGESSKANDKLNAELEENRKGFWEFLKGIVALISAYLLLEGPSWFMRKAGFPGEVPGFAEKIAK